MFTGIIEEKGTVRSISHGSNSAKLFLSAKTVCENTKTGDSIAVNGICLTVTHLEPEGFSADVMAETLARSSLGSLHAGGAVNLERALTLSSRIGGHMVSGHIDGTGTISSVRTDDIATVYTIDCDKKLLRYIIEKGSIALDGISLTVCSVTDSAFSVSIIPHTAEQTTLAEKKRGDMINIECDMVAKYIEKFTSPKFAQTDRISETFLRANGFMED